MEKDFYGNLIRPLEPITRGAIVPDEEEIAANPRARSAKLRVAKKVCQGVTFLCFEPHGEQKRMPFEKKEDP